MGLTMTEKQAVTRQLALEYKRAPKKRKGEILDSLVQLTEYNRSYAARVLRQRARHVVLGRGRAGDVDVTWVEEERTRRTGLPPPEQSKLNARIGKDDPAPIVGPLVR